MHNRKPSIQSFFQLIRYENLLLLAFTQYMVAVFLIHDSFSPLYVITQKPLLFIVLSSVLVAAAGYIINDYYDIKIDMVNKPRRVIIGRMLQRRYAIALHISLNVLALFLGLLLNKVIFLILAGTIFMLWFYSNKLKRTPLVGNLVVAFLTALGIMLPAELYQYNQKVVFAFAVYAFFVSLIRELIKDIEDMRGDARFGAKTLPVVWGIRKTKIVVYLVCAVFIASLFIAASRLSIYLSLYFGLLMAPMSFLIYKLVYADTKAAFARLSLYFKVLMLLGVLSMALK